MKKKLIIGCAVVLIMVAAILGFFLIRKNGLSEVSKLTKKEPPQTAIISLQPLSGNPVNANTVQSKVSIMVDSGGTLINGVQVELAFDPTVISDVEIEAPEEKDSLFGKQSAYFIVTKKINEGTGTILYAVGLAPRALPVSGRNSIGVMTMNVTKKPGSTAEIRFLPKTMVTVLGSDASVLKTTVPLPITFE